MAFRDTQNPGIGGLDELTTVEELFVQNLSALSYVQGDILYHNGTSLTRLPKGTALQELRMNAGATAPEWATPTSGTVTEVSSANGAATVATGTTTPVITIVSAPILTTARTINGVSFDGSANITVTADANTLTNTILKSTVVTSSLTAVGTLVTGNADAIVSAASLTVAGKVELATTAEINTGTDTTRSIPVDQYVASNRNVRYIIWRVVGDTTDWPANATLKVGGDLEFPFTGTITEIGAFVDTAGTTGTAVVDVNIAGTTIMTTNKLSFDTTEKTTRTAATAPTLTTTAITAGDILTVDVDTNHTTKAKGLSIRLGVRLT